MTPRASSGSEPFPAAWSRPAGSTTRSSAASTTRPSSTTRTAGPRPTACTAGTPGCRAAWPATEPPGAATRCVLWAEAEVAQAAVFGEQLLLTRRIEADLGGTSLRIADTVTNTGPTPCPHMILYHCNVGFPVVDDAARAGLPGAAGTLRERGLLAGVPQARGPVSQLRRGVLRARHGRRRRRIRQRGGRQPGRVDRGLPALPPAPACRITSPGGSSAPVPTWSPWSRARTGTPGASTPAPAASCSTPGPG